MRKFAVAIISFCLLAAGCQADISDADKQARIAAMYRQYAQEFPTVKGITAAELQQLQRRGKVILVDVRSP